MPNTPCTHPFITLRDDRHVWTDQNSLTGIDRQWVTRKFGKVFLHKLHLKCIQNVWIGVITDNNNFAPSLFQSLCEFVGDCFGPRYFSSGAALTLRKNTQVQNNHLQFHTMTSKKMVQRLSNEGCQIVYLFLFLFLFLFCFVFYFVFNKKEVQSYYCLMKDVRLYLFFFFFFW